MLGEEAVEAEGGFDARVLHNGKMRVCVHPNRGAGEGGTTSGRWDASRPGGVLVVCLASIT